MIGKAREAMKTQQLHQVLDAVWAVVADANRYFAGEAPWALAKTDPARQGTVLYVTAEVLRQVAHPGAAVHAGLGAESCSICWRCRRTSAVSPALGGEARALPPGTRLAGAGAGIPALCRAGAGRRNGTEAAMLVDSHCHLDFPDFADELDAVVARAQAAGVGRMVTISTRVRRHAELLAIAERFADVYLLGRHPSAPRRTRSSTSTADDLVALHAASQGGGDRRGRARLSLRQRPRDAQEQGFRTHIAAARETGLPLVIHAREADADMARILSEETGRAPSRPSCIASPAAASWRHAASSSASTSRSPAS